VAADRRWAGATRDDEPSHQRVDPRHADSDHSHAPPTPDAGLRAGPAALLRLQAKAGNRAVRRLIQAGSRRAVRDQVVEEASGTATARDTAGPAAAAPPVTTAAVTVPPAPAGHHHARPAPVHRPPVHKPPSAPRRRTPAVVPTPIPVPQTPVTTPESGPAVAPSAPATGPEPAPPPAPDLGGGNDGAGPVEEPAPGTSDSELAELDGSATTPEPPAEEPAPEEPASEAAGGEPTQEAARPELQPEPEPGGEPAVAAIDDGEPEPVPDVGAAQAEAQVEADGEAEEDRREEEQPAEPAGPEAAEAGEAGGADPEAVPEASLEAGADAEGPDATEADVQAAAGAEVDAAVADGGEEPDVGGGGGGGGAAVEEPQPAPAPDVSGVSPEQGLSQAGALPPAQLLTTLDGVQAAAQREAGEERAKLAASPPTRARAAGSPATVPGPASDRAGVPGGGGPTGPATVPAGADRPLPTPKPPPVPTNAPPGPPPPRIPEAAQDGSMGESGAAALRQAVDRMPVTDPGLRVPATAAPRVSLDGSADPGAVDAQAAESEADVQSAAAQGATDAAHPLGEDELYPTVPLETLRADADGGGGGGGGAGSGGGGGPMVAGEGAGGGGSTDDEAASIVAHQEHGGEIQAAVQQGRAQMATARSERAEGEVRERQQGEQEMARLEQENAAEQAAERDRARGEVSERRSAWRAEQAQVVGTARSEAGQARLQARQTIEQERARGDQEAARHHAEGEAEAAEAQRRGEEEAARERERGKQETSGGGLFGWIASKAKSVFDGIKRGIQAAFEAARKAVQAALAKATQLAHAAIEAARQVAVGLVKAAGAALTAIASVALAAFPRLREAAVGWIRNRVRAAETAINNLANKLKEGVTAALNLLGRALNGLLNLMEKAYLAAVNFVASAVNGIINKVRQAIQLLGALAGLIRDIAPNPGGWLRNLGAALMDGVRNHLWGAFRTSVKQWFNDKVEQVVGLGSAVWNLLKRGGLTIARIGSMVWEGIKAAIPPALIALLVEKLVSLLVPAAAAVMLIIQGLQAAWGAASRILQAFDRFFAFLRAVKGGNAGAAFATAVAAAAMAVLDFLSNFLLARLARGASKVGQKLRSIAQRIGQRLRGLVQRVGRRLRGIGRRLGRARDRLRDRLRRRRRQTPEQRRQRDQDRKQQRLAGAVAAIRPAASRLLSSGVSGARLRAQILFWRVRHRLTSLTLTGTPGFAMRATVNPSEVVINGVAYTGAQLREIIHDAALNVMARPETRDAAARMSQQRDRDLNAPVNISGPGALPGAVRHFQERTVDQPTRGSMRHYTLGEERLPFSERQGRAGQHNAIVQGIGTYPEIAQELEDLRKSTGMTDAQFAGAARRLVATGQVPARMQQHSVLLGRVVALMFGREGARDTRVVAHAPMTMDLIMRGDMSFDEAFRGYEGDPTRVGGRGAFPTSMKDASAATRGLAAEEAGIRPREVGGSTEARRRELERREQDLAVRWVTVRLQAMQGIDATDRGAVVRKVTDLLLQFYQMHR
jgi:hypothetical protein